MTKSSKNVQRKAQREAKTVQQHKRALGLASLAEREANSLVVGIDSMKVLEQDLKIARDFKPMSQAERDKLLAQVKPVAGDGRHERFKSTQFFDGPYHRKQHGLTEKDVTG